MISAVEPTPAPGLAPEDVAALAAGMERRELPAGALVPEADERGGLVHLVLSGSARLFYRARGREITIGHVGPGGLVGAAAIFGRPTDGRLAEAAEPLVLASCPGERFLELVRAEPRLVRAVLVLLCDRVVRTEQRLSELAQADARHRLLRVLEAMADARPDGAGVWRLRAAPRHEDLAHQIGASRETVTRLLKRLEADGRIRRAGGRIVLLGPDLA